MVASSIGDGANHAKARAHHAATAGNEPLAAPVAAFACVRRQARQRGFATRRWIPSRPGRLRKAIAPSTHRAYRLDYRRARSGRRAPDGHRSNPWTGRYRERREKNSSYSDTLPCECGLLYGPSDCSGCSKTGALAHTLERAFRSPRPNRAWRAASRQEPSFSWQSIRFRREQKDLTPTYRGPEAPWRGLGQSPMRRIGL
jgi:hypothetical protein